MFCVGISTAYSLINRLDKLMLATKEIVGEQYHIHGIVPFNLRRCETGGVDPEKLAEQAAAEVGVVGRDDVSGVGGGGGGGASSSALFPLSPSVSRAVSEMQREKERGRRGERKDVQLNSR